MEGKDISEQSSSCYQLKEISCTPNLDGVKYSLVSKHLRYFSVGENETVSVYLRP